MEEKYRDFTDEDISAVAMTAADAAVGKCHELGIDPVIGSVCGLKHASESSLRAMLVCTILPDEILRKMLDGHRKEQIEELIDEAEKILGIE